MINDPNLACRDETRREDVRRAALYGLDFVEVASDDQLTLEVFFLGAAPRTIGTANVAITGGSRITDVRAVAVNVHHVTDPGFDDYMTIRVNHPGDFSTYTLRLVKLDAQGRPTGDPMDGFDPVYDSVDFSFKAGCPSDLDCKPQQVCPPAPLPQPEINYLAKDYGSFRQLILDRLAVTMPDWKETHVPDLGVTLVEVLAYAADYLSYYQDAVATEAYLGTARQRISVRRHARLVDYAMHEGCNSRTWITISTDTDAPIAPDDVFFITGFVGAPDRRILTLDDLRKAPPGSYEAFEPLVADQNQPIKLYAAHSEIHFYTWGDRQCCLSTGTTSATLIDAWTNVPPAGSSTAPPAGHPAAPADHRAGPSDAQGLSNTTTSLSDPPGAVRALNLKVGDVIIFEEVIGPGTANPADADPRHRQAVRLTSVTAAVDPLYHPHGPQWGQPVVEIQWCSEDALTFPLCISVRGPAPECAYIQNVSVARGNVILVDNGITTNGSLGVVPVGSSAENCPSPCCPPDVITTPGKFSPHLDGTPLTFAEPLGPGDCASAMMRRDPRQALPQIALKGTEPALPRNLVTEWHPKFDLLESGPDDTDFVVEMDNDGYAHLRFGDGELGMLPQAGTQFAARYRLGNGPAGNVGAEKLRYIVFRDPTFGLGALTPRNPFPATGGTAPEPIAEVKMFAPFAFRKILERAVTGDDYAAIAADDARRLDDRPALLAGMRAEGDIPATGVPPPFRRLQGAKGTLRWNGSWYEAEVGLDPLGAENAAPNLIGEVTEWLEPFRRIGHDLAVRPADYVPLDLALTVCVKPEYQQAHVEAALLDAFSNRTLPNATLGFFHPDNLTFGEGVYVSRIIAAAQAVAGVQSVTVDRLERYEIGEPQAGESAAEDLPPHSVLTLGPFQIARLDNDPSFPENGRIVLNLRGGR